MTMATPRQAPVHPATTKRASGMAVASLSLALGGGLAMFAQLVFVGLVAETTAIVFGCVAFGNINHNRELYGKGMAGWAIAIAGVFLIVSVVFWVQVVTGWR